MRRSNDFTYIDEYGEIFSGTSPMKKILIGDEYWDLMQQVFVGILAHPMRKRKMLVEMLKITWPFDPLKHESVEYAYKVIINSQSTRDKLEIAKKKIVEYRARHDSSYLALCCWLNSILWILKFCEENETQDAIQSFIGNTRDLYSVLTYPLHAEYRGNYPPYEQLEQKLIEIIYKYFPKLRNERN